MGSEYLTIKQVIAQYFGNRVSTHTVRRWIAKGVGNPRVKLAAVRLGRDYFVTPEGVEDFLEAINAPGLFSRRSKAERLERAKQRLERAGT